jgi:superfamily II DNA or RNA helicase
MPTGTGKSAVIALAPYVLRAKRVLVITPAKGISNQLKKDFEQAKWVTKLGFEHSFVAPSIRGCSLFVGRERPEVKLLQSYRTHMNRAQIQAPVIIANAHKLGANAPPTESKNTDDDNDDDNDDEEVPPSTKIEILFEDPKHFDLVLVDEAHHFPSKMWKKIEEHACRNPGTLCLFPTFFFICFQACRVVFLTATPMRPDGRYILEIEDPETHDLVDFTPPIWPTGFALTPGMKLRDRRQAITTQLKELQQYAVDQKWIRPSIFVQVGPAAPVRPEGRSSKDEESTRAVLEKVVEEVCNKRGSKGLILALDIAHAKQIAEDINGLPNAGSEFAHTFVSSDSNSVMNKFKAGKHRILVLVRRELEGLDVPSISVEGICRRVGSKGSTFVQFVGRALRMSRPDDETVAVIVSAPAFGQENNVEQWLCIAGS